MYKKDLALNNLQRLICYKKKPNQTKPLHQSFVWTQLNDQMIVGGGELAICRDAVGVF